MRCQVAAQFIAVLMVVSGGGRMQAQALGDSLVAQVRVDSSRHEIVILAGPWHRPSMGDMAGMQMMHHVAVATPFSWPVDGWIRSLRFRARTRDGHDVPRSALHHLAVVNLGRRDLFYPIPERMFEMGGETADIVLPGSTAIPVVAGTSMALTIAWGNAGHDALPDVTVELTMEWLPTTTTPTPRSVFPVTMQVTTLAGATSFDLPPGEHGWGTIYALSVTGHVLAAGGHLHDFGTAILLRDLSAPASALVLSLASQHDKAGRVTGMERMMPGEAGPGIPLRAGDWYQLEGHYANPTGTTIAGGGMAFLVLLFAPDRPDDWPPADLHAASWQRFLDQIGLTRSPDDP
jgi:hypothetical protein